METSLHRQLKLAYARCEADTEVTVASFRIDAISQSGELIEIQHASLGALKRKVRQLLDHNTQHRIRIVKPIVARKWIVTKASVRGKPLRRRLSPKRGIPSDIFADLVYFAGVFPHPRLTLEILLIDAEEIRLPKAKHRFRRKSYVTLEQSLLAITQRYELRQAWDLWSLLPVVALPASFDTAELARQIDRPRWFAQKVAYCMRSCNAITPIGKQGNSQLYNLTMPHKQLEPSTPKTPRRRPAA